MQLSRNQLIDVAPDPCFPGLNGAYQRVFGCVKVLGGVLILRRITTAYVSALQAQTQVDPPVAEFHAFFANVCRAAGHADLIEMRTLIHKFLLFPVR
jgi:hypothetical protein